MIYSLAFSNRDVQFAFIYIYKYMFKKKKKKGDGAVTREKRDFPHITMRRTASLLTPA